MSISEPQDRPAESTSTASASPAKAAVGAKASLRQKYANLSPFLWPLLCIFQLALIISWSLVAGSHEHSEAEATGPAAEHPAPIEKANKKPPAPLAEEPPDPGVGEAYLIEGQFSLALPHFQPTREDGEKSVPDTMQFRAALCLEGLGRWKEALAAYRDAVAKTANPQLAAAAQVAQARIWVRKNRAHEARALLYPLLLQAGQANRVDAILLAEARYLLGMALSYEAFVDQRVDAIDEGLMRASQTTWPVVHSLSWLEAPTEAPRRSAHLPADLEALQQFGPNKEDVLVRGSMTSTGVAAVVDKVATIAQLRTVWSLAAWERIQHRTTAVAVDGVPMLEIVNGLIEPHELAWTLDKEILHIVTLAELSKDAIAEHRAAAARRVLRSAVFADPSHPLAALAFLELANDEATLGRLDEAVAWYERLLAETPRSPHIVVAHFNLGLVQRARRDHPAARKAFFGVVDRAPGHELACRAYTQIGWTYLMDGQPNDAIFPLRRAMGVGPASEAYAEAVLTLAAAHLWSGNPAEANAALASGREALGQDPWRRAGAFLDMLARYRLAAQGKTSRMESADLVAALLAFQQRPTLGPLGQLLAGQAYQDLGIGQHMAKVYEQALRTAVGPIAEEMSFALADFELTDGKRAPALKRLNDLAAMPRSKWSHSARLRLAAIALQDGHGQQCVQGCRALLQNEPLIDRNAVFQLMGNGYEQLGDLQKAARCYAGQMPD